MPEEHPVLKLNKNDRVRHLSFKTPMANIEASTHGSCMKLLWHLDTWDALLLTCVYAQARSAVLVPTKVHANSSSYDLHNTSLSLFFSFLLPVGGVWAFAHY